MAGPPEHIEASELWAALTTIPRPHRLVDVPRYLPGTKEPVGQVAIWPLTQEEQMACNAEADRFTKELLKDPQKRDEANLGYHHTFSNEVAVQTLFRACRDPKKLERPAFPSPSLLRARLTGDEIGVLYASYLTVLSEVGPIVAYMSKEETEAWVRRLAEGGSALPFDSLSWDLQRTLVVSMASQLVSFWTDTSSAGSPPDESSASTDSEPDTMSASDG